MGKREMSRNGFPDCEREYNRREEEIEMAREERREAMSDTPRTDEVWGSMHGSGYQMMLLLAEKLERELAEAKKKYLLVCSQHGRLVDQVYEEDGETLKQDRLNAELAEATAIWKGNMQLFSDKAERAEARAAALEEALSQMLDDMGADGFCVCPAAKEQAIAAMGGRDDT
jgi:hypothetical protein